ncbi:MAG: WhiB family transcriptional regulator [Acidimicrobiia bacterium]|nr:WhiB family transcriptional regulator [Acidimicrobiia bacterium]MDX2466958.1 WhiB family transcriptional regulator [Acidimicrobiia bacterium]
MNDIFDAIDPVLAVPITEERPWAAFAVCKDRDPDAFFPVTPEGEREAIRICQGCPVQADCLEFAIEARIRFGVWGGLTEKQRQRVQRQSA